MKIWKFMSQLGIGFAVIFLALGICLSTSQMRENIHYLEPQYNRLYLLMMGFLGAAIMSVFSAICAFAHRLFEAEK